MEAEIRELVATVQQPQLRALLNRLLGPGSDGWARYRQAPAAKHYHQAYPHGLLEHCLGVAQAVSAISATFPGIDRDVAVTGALLHDIGKLEAYTTDPVAIDLSDAGRLHGEIALGYYLVRRTIDEIDGFPPELAQAIGHIILSHHGSLEHGSPVVPCTREATLVHMVDNLGGRLGSFDRLEKELPPGRRWSSFDRAIGAGAFFLDRGDGAPEPARAPAPEREAA
jgi:3'-5' exoribonuclease